MFDELLRHGIEFPSSRLPLRDAEPPGDLNTAAGRAAPCWTVSVRFSEVEAAPLPAQGQILDDLQRDQQPAQLEGAAVWLLLLRVIYNQEPNPEECMYPGAAPSVRGERQGGQSGLARSTRACRSAACCAMVPLYPYSCHSGRCGMYAEIAMRERFLFGDVHMRAPLPPPISGKEWRNARAMRIAREAG